MTCPMISIKSTNHGSCQLCSPGTLTSGITGYSHKQASAGRFSAHANPNRSAIGLLRWAAR